MRVIDKLEELKGYVSELEEIMPGNLQEYVDLKTKAACERYFERIMEAVVDLSFLIIKEKGYKIPEEDKEAFDILVKEGFISQELSEKLKDAKGMRNIIAHEYGKIDDELVFHSITEELVEDVNGLIKEVRKGLVKK
jgi:uncharacterized protein YutE (UPF0331/DUF86 family)